MMIGSENIATSAEKILQAATELFAMNNFNAVSIKQIASASGCNSALISYYFGGKEKLYDEIISDSVRKQNEFMERFIDIQLMIKFL